MIEWIDDIMGIRSIPTESGDGKHTPSTCYRVVMKVTPNGYTIDLESLHATKASAMKEIDDVWQKWNKLDHEEDERVRTNIYNLLEKSYNDTIDKYAVIDEAIRILLQLHKKYVKEHLQKLLGPSLQEGEEIDYLMEFYRIEMIDSISKTLGTQGIGGVPEGIKEFLIDHMGEQ